MRVYTSLALVIALLAPAIAKAGTTGALNGTVRDIETHTPVANALVTVTSIQDTQNTRTDQTGHFVFVDLPIGRYTIDVLKDGFVHTLAGAYYVVADAETTVPIELSRPLKTIDHVRHFDWPSLVDSYTTSDVYVPAWGHSFVNPFDSVFPLLWSVPGLTFGDAPRTMR